MKKQKIRFYAALLCSSMVFSLVSTPVSAAETGQLTNPPTSTEGPGSPESASGNEAAAILNGLSVSALTANRVAEVTTAEHLTDMLADSSVVKITLAENIYIGSTLTVNRAVTLDLNGNVLKMNGSGSVIKVESGGNLTIQDSNTSTPHKFTPGGDGLWGLDETGGSEIVYGGIITGGNTPNGGGVYVATGCQLTMTGGNIVGCLATYEGGGVYIDGLRGSSDQTVFTMTGGSITGCQANGTDGGGGVNVTKGTFTMKGGGVYNLGTFTMIGGIIEDDCTASGSGGGVYNAKVLFANGGEIAGNVMNGDRYPSGTITGSGGTRFSGKVINNKNEDGNKSIIECGTFTGEVSNEGEILGGDFSQANLSGTLVITFDPDNGDQSSTKEVHLGSDGAALTPPDPTPTKEGYTLDGWYWYYNNNGAETKWNFDTDKARYTMTLKAKWTKNTTPIIPGNGTNNIVEQYKTDDSNSGEQTDREVPSSVVKNTTSYLTYTVQAGDTLWAIARKYNCSITGIMAANSDRIKNPNRIHAGWQLKIPQSGAPITGGTPDAVLPENKKSGIYIVRQGDTLWKIARKYGCSVAEIISLNRELIRNPALIYSGWELKIPQD